MAIDRLGPRPAIVPASSPTQPGAAPPPPGAGPTGDRFGGALPQPELGGPLHGTNGLAGAATFRAGTVALSGGAVLQPEASSLRTEALNDGSENCLERAFELSGPGDQILLYEDTRDGAGHAIVQRPDGTVVDPNDTAVTYPDQAAWERTHAHYQSPVAVPQESLEAVLALPPGAARDRQIQRLGLAGVSDRLVADSASPAAMLTELMADAAAAEEETAALDARLAAQLTRYGPALTDSQRAAFIEEFKAAHPEYAQAQQAQQALADHLQSNGAALRDAALADPATAQLLGESLQTLVGGVHNDVVFELLNDPALAGALTGALGAETFTNELLTPALVTRGSAGLMAAGADPSARNEVFAELAAFTDSLGTVPELAGAVAEASDVLGQLGGAFQTATSYEELFTELNRINTGIAGSSSLLDEALAGLGFLGGASLVADGALNGDGEAALQGFLQMGQNAEAVSAGLTYAARALPGLAGTAQFATKVMPVIGVIANAAVFVDQLDGMDTDAERVNAASSFATAAGSAMMLIPFGQIPGALFMALGAIGSIIGGELGRREEEAVASQYDAEARELLANLDEPVDVAVLELLRTLDPAVANNLTENGMDPDAWGDAANDPELAAFVSSLKDWNSPVIDAAVEAGFSPAELKALIDRHPDLRIMEHNDHASNLVAGGLRGSAGLGLTPDQLDQLLTQSSDPRATLDVLRLLGSYTPNPDQPFEVLVGDQFAGLNDPAVIQLLEQHLRETGRLP